MSELNQPTNFTEQIQASQKISDLLQIFAGISSHNELLLRNFEELIIDKVIDLLSNSIERYWCSVEEYQFLIEGLNSKLSAQYKAALELALEQGLSDFDVAIPIFNKLLISYKDLFKDDNKTFDPLELIENDQKIMPAINGARRAINHGSKDVGRRRGKSLPQEPPPSLDKFSFQEMIGNANNFFLALLSLDDADTQVMALDIFQNPAIEDTREKYCLIDIILVAEKDHPDQKVRYMSRYIAATMAIIGSILTTRAEELVKKINNPKHEIKSLGKQFEIINGTYSQAKAAILSIVLDLSGDKDSDENFFRNVHQLGEVKNKIIKAKSKPLALLHRPDDFSHAPLADKALKLGLDLQLDIIKAYGGYDGFVFPSHTVNFPPENILLVWEKYITKDQVDSSDINPQYFIDLLPHIAILSNEDLRNSEVAALLAFLRPDEELDQAMSLEDLKNEARGGMYPLSKRGVTIVIDSNNGKDALISKTGLERITFKRNKKNRTIQVIARFGHRDFIFSINEDMSIPKLKPPTEEEIKNNSQRESLASAESEWLQRVIFSYLVAIKNRDIYQCTKIDGDEIKNETLRLAAVEGSQESRTTSTRGSHLYVLPYSQQPQGWDDSKSEINKEVENEIGYSLRELNFHFTQAQKDTEYLNGVTDESLKRIVISSLKRLEGKEDPENFSEGRSEAIKKRITEVFLGESDQIDIQGVERLAMIGYRHEPEDPAGPPLILRFSFVSENLFANQDQEF